MCLSSASIFVRDVPCYEREAGGRRQEETKGFDGLMLWFRNEYEAELPAVGCWEKCNERCISRHRLCFVVFVQWLSKKCNSSKRTYIHACIFSFFPSSFSFVSVLRSSYMFSDCGGQCSHSTCSFTFFWYLQCCWLLVLVSVFGVWYIHDACT